MCFRKSKVKTLSQEDAAKQRAAQMGIGVVSAERDAAPSHSRIADFRGLATNRENATETATETATDRIVFDAAKTHRIIGNIFIAQQIIKEILKFIFFVIILVILGFVLYGMAFFVSKLVGEPLLDPKSIVAFASAIAGGLTALLALPTIVAKYLFNPEESQETVKLIQTILEHGFRMSGEKPKS